MAKALLLGLLGVWLVGCAAPSIEKRTPAQEAYVQDINAQNAAKAKAENSEDLRVSEEFLARWPNSRYRVNILKHMEKVRARQQEAEKPKPSPDEEYSLVRQQDTIEAYQDYLHRHRRTDPHYDEALARLDELLHPGGRLAQDQDPSGIIVTTGTLSQPYTPLGEVHVSTVGEVYLGSLLNDTLFRSKFSRAVQATPATNTATMNEKLKVEAQKRYGSAARAVINVSYRTDPDGDIYASGLAVRFVEPQVPQAVSPSSPTLEQKLTELKSLREKGLITSEEYYEKRSELLKEF